MNMIKNKSYDLCVHGQEYAVVPWVKQRLKFSYNLWYHLLTMVQGRVVAKRVAKLVSE